MHSMHIYVKECWERARALSQVFPMHFQCIFNAFQWVKCWERARALSHSISVAREHWERWPRGIISGYIFQGHVEDMGCGLVSESQWECVGKEPGLFLKLFPMHFNAFQCISVGRVLRKSPGPFSPYFHCMQQFDSDKCVPGGYNLDLVSERARALSQRFSYAFQCISMGKVLRKSPGPFWPFSDCIE